VPSEVIFGVFEAREHESTRPELMCFSCDPDAKGVAAGLIRDLAFDPEDDGLVRTARFTEPFSLLVAQL
jgi:predicted dinucleotide-binding enzyme